MFTQKEIGFIAIGALLSFSLAGLGWNARAVQSVAVTSEFKTQEESDPHVRFAMEAFDSIQKNYWKKASEADLAELFRLSIEKAAGTSTPLLTNDRAGAAKMMHTALTAVEEGKRKQLLLDTLIVATYNLAPAGRNGILSNKQETELRQNVSNIDPNKDLYASVGAATGASAEEVTKAFEEKKAELEKANTPEAKQELEKAEYAKDVLTKEDTKARYDTAKIEPTIFYQVMGKTLYLYISKMSPTTLDEFVAAIKDADKTKGLDSMIIDVRGNIGGSLDIAPYVIGLFMGPNQYVFDLYHQDEYEVIRSPVDKMPELARYGDIAILTDGITQSTAELIPAALKRFNLAKTVGTGTRGWGTVENTFKIDTSIDPSETYALFLVHSLTLRDDNQPIESNGVVPNININDANWRTQLSANFRSVSLIENVRDLATKSPLKE